MMVGMGPIHRHTERFGRGGGGGGSKIPNRLPPRRLFFGFHPRSPVRKIPGKFFWQAPTDPHPPPVEEFDGGSPSGAVPRLHPRAA